MKIDNAVLAVLSAAQTNGRALVLQGQLDRRLYEKANQVLQAAGGTWNRKARAHIFAVDAAEAIDPLLLTGEVDRPQDFGYFPTPPVLVERLLGPLSLTPEDIALEPSGGRGAIAGALAAICETHTFELLPDNLDALRSLQADLPRLSQVSRADFLSVDPDPIYSVVAMNPPFSRQADILHVSHALKFLRPGVGRLAAIMSAGVKYREDRRAVEFRECVARRGGSIESLPEGSFKASGTGVNTVLVRIPAA